MRENLRLKLMKNCIKIFIFLISFTLCAQALAAEDPDELYGEGRFAEAQEAYNNLDMKNPKDIRFRYNRGCAAYQNSDYQGAMAAFSSVLRRIKSKDPSSNRDDQIRLKAAYNMGNVAFRQGDFVSAANYYKEAILYNSENDDARYNLELSLKKLGEQKNKEGAKSESSKGDKEGGKQSKEGKDSKDSSNSSHEKTPKKTRDEKETQGMDREQKEDKSGPEERDKKKEDGAPPKKRQEAKGSSSKDLSGELKPRQALAEKQGENQVPGSGTSIMNKTKAEALLDNVNEDRSRFLRFQIPEEKRNGVASGRDW